MEFTDFHSQLVLGIRKCLKRNEEIKLKETVRESVLSTAQELAAVSEETGTLIEQLLIEAMPIRDFTIHNLIYDSNAV